MPLPMGPGGGMPMGPMAQLASPEMRGGPPTPEARTLLASPLADRLAGGLAPPPNPQLPKLVALARQALQAIAVMLRDIDPKASADVEMFGAKLLKMVPQQPPAPGPGQIPGMAAGLPPGGQQMPPPMVPGTAPGMTGPLAGL